MNTLKIIGRNKPLFDVDMLKNEAFISEKISEGSFLIIGGAGSIGQAVVKEVFKRSPRILHVIDINENNLVELVRDIRSTYGYIKGDFRTFAIDCGSREFEVFFEAMRPYDYVLNLSALKHVRSEKDPYTLMRLIEVNILNNIKLLNFLKKTTIKKFFSVSTDKAANPVNMMGASKRIMEMFIMRESEFTDISFARFANVAFSEGSLLYGFSQRFQKLQPMSAPFDVRRYFLTPQESGELCLMSCLLGSNRDILFPKLDTELKPETFSNIAIRFIEDCGYTPVICDSETEARDKFSELIQLNKWPCYFFASDTSGEKDIEEFFTLNEKIDNDSFESIGVIKNEPFVDSYKLDNFIEGLEVIRKSSSWSKPAIIELFNSTLPNFAHYETGKYLDSKM
jgi:FlaA1/EpsC-like NDP-sugar epimerase